MRHDPATMTVHAQTTVLSNIASKVAVQAWRINYFAMNAFDPTMSFKNVISVIEKIARITGDLALPEVMAKIPLVVASATTWTIEAYIFQINHEIQDIFKH